MNKIYLILMLVFFSNINFGQNGLIGSWPFSGNANNVATLGNNGIVNNATLTNDRFGNPNSAYLFNGVNSYIDLGQGYTYSSHSFVCWARKDSLNGPNIVLSKVNNGPYDTKNSELHLNSYMVGSGTNWLSVTSTNTTLVLSQWNHYVGTYDVATNKLKIYINGVVDSINVSNYFDVANTKIYVGARPFWSGTGSTTFYFKGAIDDISIYNKAISKHMVDSLYNLTPTNIKANSNKPTLEIYPNPANSNLYIAGLKIEDVLQIQVTDVLGRIVLNPMPSNNIDVSSLQKGVYFLKIIGINSKQVKFLKD